MKHARSLGLGLAAVVTACWGVVHAGGFQITTHNLSPGGGTSVSAGGCRQLEATFGEPVNGRSTGGSFVLVTGYQARLGAARGDAIFNDGFQECL